MKDFICSKFTNVSSSVTGDNEDTSTTIVTCTRGRAYIWIWRAVDMDSTVALKDVFKSGYFDQAVFRDASGRTVPQMTSKYIIQGNFDTKPGM